MNLGRPNFDNRGVNQNSDSNQELSTSSESSKDLFGRPSTLLQMLPPDSSLDFLYHNLPTYLRHSTLANRFYLSPHPSSLLEDAAADGAPCDPNSHLLLLPPPPPTLPPRENSNPLLRFLYRRRSAENSSLFPPPFILRGTNTNNENRLPNDDFNRPQREQLSPNLSPFSDDAQALNSFTQDNTLGRDIPATLHLPSRWNIDDRCSFLKLDSHCYVATYDGPGRTDNDSAAVRSDYPVPNNCGIYYFEATILAKGREGFIALGFSTSTVSLTRLPGWEPNSYGYHGDDGQKFHGGGKGDPYGPTFTVDDIIGCGLDFELGEIFFTKNGLLLPTAFKDVPITAKHSANLYSSGTDECITLYPTLGLRTPGESVKVNFGHSRFVYNIDEHVSRLREEAWTKIVHDNPCPLNNKEVLSLVLGHLSHNGYTKTLKVMQKEIKEMSLVEDPTELLNDDITSSVEIRQSINNSIIEGKIDEAMALLESSYPDILKRNPDLHSEFVIQTFLQFLRNKNPIGALKYGRQNVVLLTRHPCSQAALSLLAYTNFEIAPERSLLENSRLDLLADMVNSAIMKFCGFPPRPALEQIVRQAVVLSTEASLHIPGRLPLLNIHDILSSALSDSTENHRKKLPTDPTTSAISKKKNSKKNSSCTSSKSLSSDNSNDNN